MPFTGTTPYNHALYGLKPAANPSKEKQSTALPPRRLLPEEVKEEQARLLTLLRTIQPLRVVDQLCKALAYFGGIPDAPPPKEGMFPESAEANGSGAVFIGWVAEIFPDLDADGRRKSRPPVARPIVAPSPAPAQSTEKRGRGRPKGSKASKARSDKGIKKGSLKTTISGPLAAKQASEWIDVDDSRLQDNDRDDDETEDEGAGDVVMTGAQNAQPSGTDGDEARAGATKRSQSKASRKSAKDGPTEEFTPNPAPISALFSIGKKGSGGRGGRPKGVPRNGASRKQPSPTNFVSAANGPEPVVAPKPPAAMPQTAGPTEASQPGDEYSLAALQAYNENLSTESNAPSSSFQPVNSASAPGVPPTTVTTATAKTKAKPKAPAKKRKRNAKDGEDILQVASGSTPSMPEPTGGMAQPVNVDPQPEASATAPALLAPPAPKRQRKSRAKPKTTNLDKSVTDESVAGAASQAAQAPANVPAPMPVPAPAMQPVENMYTTPTIEELEAQLENDTQSPPPAYTEFGAIQTTKQPQPPPALLQPPPPQQDFQAQAAPKPRQPQQSPLSLEPQRAVARPRQQYQQATARTASPNIVQGSTASPHLSVQSASPSMGTAASVASPNIHQQRVTNSQTPTSITSQIQSQPSRNTQSYYTQQTNPSTSSYGQQTNSQYGSPQPAKQPFAVPQSQQQQSYSSAHQPLQQQPNYTSQQQQYSQQKQQSYPSQPPYSSPQQQYSSQRLQQQQYNTTSAETTPQTLAAPSPQYGTSATSGYNSNDGSYRANSATGLGFNSTAYGSNQAPQASRGNSMYPSTTNGSYASPIQPASTFPAAPPSRRNLPTTATNHAPVQNVQSNLPQSFGGLSDFGSLGFENNIMSGLDSTAGSHGSLGLNAASYNMTTGNVSRPPTGSTNFGFDSGMRNDGTSYFGSLRR